MLDHDCFELWNDALSRTLRKEEIEPYFKRAANSALQTLKSCIKEEHAYADYWDGFEKQAIDQDLAVWRLANAQIDFNKNYSTISKSTLKNNYSKEEIKR